MKAILPLYQGLNPRPLGSHLPLAGTMRSPGRSGSFIPPEPEDDLKKCGMEVRRQHGEGWGNKSGMKGVACFRDSSGWMHRAKPRSLSLRLVRGETLAPHLPTRVS
jgi:hypothetical protein